MRLTRAGADYSLAVLLLAATGLATGEGLFAALALGLAFTSLISLAMLRLRVPAAVEVGAVDPKVRVFKGEPGTIVLRVPGFRDTWAHVELESATVEGPVDTTVIRGPDGISLSVRPSAAGRFTKLEVRLGLRDAIGIFSVRRSVWLAGVEIDSLPLSLLSPVQRPFVPPLVVGESPAGTAGKGQEFYGIEAYTERSESKDILWKRAAKQPDRPLLSRVREANNPESVAINLVHGEMDDETRVGCIDLQCEALGILGRALLLAGISVEITGPNGSTHRAEDDEGLVESIMEVSTGGPSGSPSKYPTGWLAIMVVVGRVDEGVLAAMIRRPTVMIGGGRVEPLDRYGVVFTGAEDLTRIVNLVLAA